MASQNLRWKAESAPGASRLGGWAERSSTAFSRPWMSNPEVPSRVGSPVGADEEGATRFISDDVNGPDPKAEAAGSVAAEA